MHIQACALIYNLASKRKNAKRVAWNEYQQHCTLGSPPPPHLCCTADALTRPVSSLCKPAVFPPVFCQEENTSTLETFSDTKAELRTAWVTRHKGQQSQTKTQAAVLPEYLLSP